MAEKIKNLCAPIPEELHAKVRQKQEESGLALGPYMTQLIEKFFETEGKTMANSNQRTVAFQVDTELFERFKAYLKAHGIKQNAFFLNRITWALNHPETGGIASGRRQIYDGLSRVLCEYEDSTEPHTELEERLYDMLVNIQQGWEEIITAEN